MSGSHYYTREGELIDGDLRLCRKLNGLPSPTTVLNILGSPGLKWYFRRQMWEAAVTTPRLLGETDDEYWERCQVSADQHGQAARDRGGEFHTLVQRFHIKPHGSEAPPTDHPMSAQYDAYIDWYFTNVRRSLVVEQTVIGQGYAGRVDHVAEMMDGSISVLDCKTQDTTKKKGKFTFYDQWPLQLAAYAGAIKPLPDCLISVAISSNLPAVVEAKVWEKPVEYYHGLFLGLLEYWKHSNEYYPV